MTLFAIYKKDEDCFTCFQRADCETYSIFQVKSSFFSDDLDLSAVSEEIYGNNNNEALIQKQLGQDIIKSGYSQERTSSIQNRDRTESLNNSEVVKSFDSEYYLKQQEEIEQREAKRMIDPNYEENEDI